MSAQEAGVSRNSLRLGFILALIFCLISGPLTSLGPLDVRVFDLVMVFVCFALVAHLVSDSEVVIPRHNAIWGTAIAYFGLALALPIAGLLVYNYPIGYVVGDLRWIQVGILGFAGLVLYGQKVRLLVHDLEIAATILLATHLVFFVIQYLDYNEIVNTSRVLGAWYTNQSAYGGYGYHSGRYAGAAVTSSTLGLGATVSIAVFGRSLLVERRGVGQLAIAGLLLLASGHRTSMVAVLGIVGVAVCYQLGQSFSIEIPSKKITSAVVGVGLVFVLAVQYNLGRLGASDRYSELFAVLISPSLFLEISGRGGRWTPALERAESYPIGTLSNPAWVFHDLEPVDSYFVLTYIQGDVLFLGAYLLFLGAVAVSSIRLLVHDDRAILPLSFAGIMVAFSLTQNFMTSISGKVIAVLSIVILLSIYATGKSQNYWSRMSNS